MEIGDLVRAKTTYYNTLSKYIIERQTYLVVHVLHLTTRTYIEIETLEGENMGAYNEEWFEVLGEHEPAENEDYNKWNL